jgi:hypothetical protein
MIFQASRPRIGRDRPARSAPCAPATFSIFGGTPPPSADPTAPGSVRLGAVQSFFAHLFGPESGYGSLAVVIVNRLAEQYGREHG